MRMLSGILAGQPFDTQLVGDESLTARPMGRVVAPLREMGAQVEARDGKFAPLKISGRRFLSPIDWKIHVASAQVKTCLLLAGLYAEGVTAIEEPYKSRDHTERMMIASGIKLEVHGCRVSLAGGQSLEPQEWVIPNDISSAAFFVVAALISPHSEILLRNVGMNPTRDGLLETLAQMGASIKREDQRVMGGGTCL